MANRKKRTKMHQTHPVDDSIKSAKPSVVAKFANGVKKSTNYIPKVKTSGSTTVKNNDTQNLRRGNR